MDKYSEDIQFLHNLANTYSFFLNHSHFERCKMISLMVLIYISLMTDNVEHIFLYLLAISISSLENCPFKSLVNFLIGLLCFFFLLLFCPWVVGFPYIFCKLSIFACSFGVISMKSWNNVYLFGEELNYQVSKM